jgi:hypothetical protein
LPAVCGLRNCATLLHLSVKPIRHELLFGLLVAVVFPVLGIGLLLRKKFAVLMVYGIVIWSLTELLLKLLRSQGRFTDSQGMHELWQLGASLIFWIMCAPYYQRRFSEFS